MDSAIVWTLAALTAGLIASVFIVAMVELDEIDEISEHSSGN